MFERQQSFYRLQLAFHIQTIMPFSLSWLKKPNKKLKIKESRHTPNNLVHTHNSDSSANIADTSSLGRTCQVWSLHSHIIIIVITANNPADAGTHGRSGVPACAYWEVDVWVTHSLIKGTSSSTLSIQGCLQREYWKAKSWDSRLEESWFFSSTD
jgi:hypothetical protein